MADGAHDPVAQEPRALPVASCLREPDEALVAFANRLHHLVAASPKLRLVRGCHHRPEADGTSVFADSSGLLWEPVAPLTRAADDLDEQMAVLALYEGGLAALEHALGLRFSPDAIVNSWDPSTQWIEVGYGDQISAFGFLPGLCSAATLTDQTEPLKPARTPFAAALLLGGPAVLLDEVEALLPGALICLPDGPVKATLETGFDARCLPGLWDPWSGKLDGARPTGAEAMAETNPSEPQTSLKVPLTVCLPSLAVPASDIEALAEGGTISLSPLADGLEARLLVAGRPIAHGEIVRLGDNFAFLVDRMVLEPPPEAPVPAETETGDA
ncbi:MAG: FliM/FliN family flagellar motor switch protein [Pseudomonadota bacterium]